MVDPDLLVIYSFLQVFGKFPVFRKLTFKSIEEWLESSSTTGGNFQHCLHLLLGKQPQHKSFLTKLLEFCSYSLGNGTFRARQLHNCPPSLKLKILLGLLERQLVMNKQLKKFLNCGSERLRVRPVGQDKHGSTYMLFMDRELDIRIYKLNDEGDGEWMLLAKDKDSFEKLVTTLEEEIPLKDDTSVVDKFDDSKMNTSNLVGNFALHEKEHEDLINDSPSCDEVPECRGCKRKASNLSDAMSEFRPIHWTRIDPICSICKHKTLIDGLEERLLIYSESLDKLPSANPGVQSYSNENSNERQALAEAPLLSDEVTSSNMAIPDSSPKEFEPEELHVPDTQSESIRELPSPVRKVPVVDPVVDEVPSSPSECEDNEIKDPSFEFNLCEHTDDDEDFDGVEVREDVPPNSKKKEKTRKTQCSKNRPRTNKSNRFQPSRQEQRTGRKQRPSTKAAGGRKHQSSFLNSGVSSTTTTTSGLFPRHNSYQTAPSARQHNFTSRSSSFSITSQSMPSHYEFGCIGAVNHRNGSKVSKIGNSTSFTGKLAGRGNPNESASASDRPFYVRLPLGAAPSKSFSSYGSDGFCDDPTEGEFYDGDEEGCEDWAWEDYDETYEYGDYDPGEYEDDGGDQNREEKEGEDNLPSEFCNDATLVTLENEGDVEESYTTLEAEDIGSQEVVDISDGEMYEDTYEDDCDAQEYEDPTNEPRYRDDYADDYDDGDDAQEENLEGEEEYDELEDGDRQEGYLDSDRPLASRPHRERSEEFYDFTEDSRQVPEDDCFVVEVIE